MQISLEKIVEIVVKEVIKELVKNGVAIDQSSLGFSKPQQKRSLEMDMSAFKTPVLTENNLGFLGEDIHEIIVPKKTIITPGGRAIINKRALKIIYKP